MLDEINEAIAELESTSPSMRSLSMLATLYTVRDHYTEPMSREKAIEWTSKMQNADGTSGPHWPIEKTTQAMDEFGIQDDAQKFYVAMNMMYSDYCRVAQQMNTNTAEFYARMAKAFLDDPDAKGDKLTRYYESIVK